MSISLRATSTGPNNSSTSTTINLPTGTTTNDLTIIAGSMGLTQFSTFVTATIPSGWTTVCNCNGQFACYRLFQPGDPSSVTFTATATFFWETAAISYTGCDTTTPVDASNSRYTIAAASTAFNTGTSYIAPSVNPSWQNDLLVGCFMNSSISSAGTITVPSGFTTRVTSTNGPNVNFCDKQLSSGAATGNVAATWGNDIDFHTGVQIALHASGDSSVTPASATCTWGGVYGFTNTASSVTPLLTSLNPQVGDLVCIWTSLSTGTWGTPSGYTLQASGQGNYLFTRSFQNGDTNPTLTQSGGGSYFSNTALFTLRTSGGSTNPSIDQTNTQVGSGTPSSATLSTLTPAGSTEYLLAMWGQNSTSGSTWTPSGSLTNEGSSGFGPSILVMDTQPASNPTGTFTSSSSLNNTIFAAELLVSVAPSATNVSITGVSSTSAAGTLVVHPTLPFRAGIASYPIAAGAIAQSDLAVPVTGVATTSTVGTLSIEVDHSVALTGVAATSAIGTLSIEVDTSIALTGVAATSAVGTLSAGAETDVALIGVAATFAIGTLSVEADTDVTLTGVSATGSVGSPSVEVDAHVTGVAATSAVGLLVGAITLSGVAATSAIGVLTAILGTNVVLTGVATTSGIGTLSVEASGTVLTGVQAAFTPAFLYVQTGPNTTLARVTGVLGTYAVGALQTRLTVSLVGVAATVGITGPQVAVSKEGMRITGIQVTANPLPVSELLTTLRWSDTDGQSWSDSSLKSIGTGGAYLTSLQWRRLGMSRRGRVFELSWSAPVATALGGVTIMYEDAST